MDQYKIKTEGDDIVIYSDTGRKYLLTAADTIFNRKTYDICVIFEEPDSEYCVAPLDLVDYFYGVSSVKNEKELLLLAIPYIREYEKYHRNDDQYSSQF